MKKVVISTIVLLTLGFSPSVFSAENRGITMKVKTLAKNNEAGKQWVLLIGINKYTELEPLKNPVKDLKEISKVLTSKYYIDETIELYDEKATKSNIIKTFRELQKKVKINDSLLIIYAGHGFLDQSSNTGSWIPVDGGKDELNQSNWIANTQIRGLIGNFKSRHILLISDSCFSGDILNKNRGLDISKLDNNYFSSAYQKVSRQVMTSGASEFVPDQSEFAQQLKMSLEGNNKPFLDPLMLFGEIRSGVSKTTPMLGSLDGTGHQEGGSFLLFLKDEAKPETKVVINEKKDDDKIEVSLENTYGSLSIRSKFAGSLFIDEKFISEVIKGQILSIKKLKTGNHKLEIKGDKVSEVKEVEIEEGLLSEVIFEKMVVVAKSEEKIIEKKAEKIVKNEPEVIDNKIEEKVREDKVIQAEEKKNKLDKKSDDIVSVPKEKEVPLKNELGIGNFLWKGFGNFEDKLSSYEFKVGYLSLLNKDDKDYAYYDNCLYFDFTFWLTRFGFDLSYNNNTFYTNYTNSPKSKTGSLLSKVGLKYRFLGNSDRDFMATIGLAGLYTKVFPRVTYDWSIKDYSSTTTNQATNNYIFIRPSLDFDIPIINFLSIYNRNIFEINVWNDSNVDLTKMYKNIYSSLGLSFNLNSNYSIQGGYSLNINNVFSSETNSKPFFYNGFQLGLLARF